MILTSTPLRVSLFGGGTDYPEWFLDHGGAVLGMAIDRYVYVGVKAMPPGQLGAGAVPLRYRIQYSHVDECREISDIRHRPVRAAFQYMKDMGHDEPMELHTFSDLPGRSGLGGSSSFVIGMLAALQAYYGIKINEPMDLGREAIAFERHVIPEAVGFQDQVFATIGGLNYVKFGAEIDVKRIVLPPNRLRELEESLVLVYSGSMRDAHVMASKQVERIPQNGAALARMAQMARDGARALEDPGTPVWYLGRMLHEAWELKRELHPEISTPDIDALYARGVAAGAVGGKLLGAGGGGFMLFYVLPERRKRFEELIGAPCLGFKVAHEGCRVVLWQP